MEIDGSKVSFTPDEAHWAQEATMRFYTAPELSQRILDARVELVGQDSLSEEIPKVIDTRRNIVGRLALGRVSDEIRQLSVNKVSESEGIEEQTINLELSLSDKTKLLRLATTDYSLSLERVLVNEVTEGLEFPTTLDEKTALDEAGFNAETVAAYDADQLREAQELTAMLNPLIATLRDDLKGESSI